MKFYLSIMLLILCWSCSSESTTNGTNSQNTSLSSSNGQQESAGVAMDAFIQDNDALRMYREVTKDIHSLKTLLQSPSKNVNLFVPTNEAFKQHAPELVNKSLTVRNKYFKENCIMTYGKKDDDFTGYGDTYGGKAVKLDIQNNTVTIGGQSANITNVITLNKGNQLYQIDKVIQ